MALSVLAAGPPWSGPSASKWTFRNRGHGDLNLGPHPYQDLAIDDRAPCHPILPGLSIDERHKDAVMGGAPREATAPYLAATRWRVD